MTECHQPQGPWNYLLGPCKDLNTAIFIIYSPIHHSNENLLDTHCTTYPVWDTGAEQWSIQPWSKPCSCGDTARLLPVLCQGSLWGLMCWEMFRRISVQPTPSCLTCSGLKFLTWKMKYYLPCCIFMRIQWKVLIVMPDTKCNHAWWLSLWWSSIMVTVQKVTTVIYFLLCIYMRGSLLGQFLRWC